MLDHARAGGMERDDRCDAPMARALVRPSATSPDRPALVLHEFEAFEDSIARRLAAGADRS
jgi:hypothetical protein